MTPWRVRRRVMGSWCCRHRDLLLHLLTYLLVVGGYVRLLAAPRSLSVLPYSAFLITAVLYLHGRRARPPIVWWLVALATTFMPFDVSLHNAPGPPHFVPLVMGYPSPEMWLPAGRAPAR